MSVATIIPRVLPAAFLEHIKMPNWAQKWLAGIPYAVLGALIIPGIFSTVPQQPWIGAGGGVVALIMSLKQVAIGPTIVTAIITVVLLQSLF